MHRSKGHRYPRVTHDSDMIRVLSVPRVPNPPLISRFHKSTRMPGARSSKSCVQPKLAEAASISHPLQETSGALPKSPPATLHHTHSRRMVRAVAAQRPCSRRLPAGRPGAPARAQHRKRSAPQPRLATLSSCEAMRAPAAAACPAAATHLDPPHVRCVLRAGVWRHRVAHGQGGGAARRWPPHMCARHASLEQAMHLGRHWCAAHDERVGGRHGKP